MCPSCLAALMSGLLRLCEARNLLFLSAKPSQGKMIRQQHMYDPRNPHLLWGEVLSQDILPSSAVTRWRTSGEGTTITQRWCHLCSSIFVMMEENTISMKSQISVRFSPELHFHFWCLHPDLQQGDGQSTWVCSRGSEGGKKWGRNASRTAKSSADEDLFRGNFLVRSAKP